ncbi:hypothetical protein V8C86DRAFT_2566396 [Haematococcus lacustris]
MSTDFDRGSTAGRRSVKAQTLDSLSDKLRDKCLQLAKQRRHHILASRRAAFLGGAGQLAESDIRSEIKRCVKESFATEAVQHSVQPPLAAPWPSQDEVEHELNCHLGEEERAALEEWLYQEVVEQQMQEWALEMEAYQGSCLAGAEAAPDRDSEGAEFVLCPSCRQCSLVQVQGQLGCPREGWHLALTCEGPMLAYTRQQLAALYEGHSSSVMADTGQPCPGTLTFKVEAPAPGCTALVARCTACQLLQIIV